jgi:hypothetical protein
MKHHLLTLALASLMAHRHHHSGEIHEGECRWEDLHLEPGTPVHHYRYGSGRGTASMYRSSERVTRPFQ